MASRLRLFLCSAGAGRRKLEWDEDTDERRFDRARFSCHDRGAGIFCHGYLRREEAVLGGGLALDREAGQFPCPHEDACEHDPVEAPGVGVAQRGVIGAEQA